RRVKEKKNPRLTSGRRANARGAGHETRTAWLSSVLHQSTFGRDHGAICRKFQAFPNFDASEPRKVGKRRRMRLAAGLGRRKRYTPEGAARACISTRSMLCD